MRRKWIIRLLWASLGIHVLYFILSGIIVANQQKILELLSDIIEPHLFSAPALMSENFVLLLAHAVLAAVLMRRRPSVRRRSMTGEWTAVLLFGVGFPIFTLIGNRMAFMVIARLIGAYGLVSYSLLQRMFGLAAPIRLIGVSLFLLAVGMSIYEKQSDRNSLFAKPKQIEKLLWWSVGLDAVFFLIMMVIIVFQNQIKTLWGVPEICFVWPVTFTLSYGVLLALHLILTFFLVRQLKAGGRKIVCEIPGILLFSGWLEWVNLYLSWLSSLILAREGITVLSNYSAITQIIGTFSPIHTIGISLFIISCGMMIDRSLSP